MTPRQTQIAERVAKGLLNKQIAYELGITEATVKMHLSRLYGSLRIRGRGELTALMAKQA